MGKGWILIHRDITDHWIWEDAEKLRAWLDLIMLANHEQHKIVLREGLVTVKRGQFVTSIGKLANRWHWSKERVYRFLKLLECDGMITRNSNKYKTVITIVNYGKYQNKGNADKTTKKSSNKSTDKSSDESRTTMNNNDINNEKEDSSPTSIEEAPVEEEFDWDSYPEEGVYDENGKRVF